jgi:hypothetical protein
MQTSRVRLTLPSNIGNLLPGQNEIQKSRCGIIKLCYFRGGFQITGCWFATGDAFQLRDVLVVFWRFRTQLLLHAIQKIALASFFCVCNSSCVRKRQKTTSMCQWSSGYYQGVEVVWSPLGAISARVVNYNCNNQPPSLLVLVCVRK